MRRQTIVAGGILALALLTRLVGVTHHLPTDENKLVGPAAGLRVRDTDRPLAPSGARYPHLGYYLHGGIFSVVGQIVPKDAWDPTTVARITTVIIGVLTVALTIWLGRHIGGWALGLLGGLFAAVSPLAVKYAHYAHVDPLAAFFMLATVAAAFLLWEKGTRRWYVTTGVLTGLAAASQYYGIMVGIALVFAHAGWALRQSHWWRTLLRPAFIVGLFMIPLTFALTNPWKLIERQEARAIYHGLSLRAAGGDLGYTSSDLLWPLLTQSPDWGLSFTVSGFVWEMPLAVFLLAVGGVIVAAWRRDYRAVVLLGGVLFVLYIVMAAYVRMHAVKRFLPLTPLLALAAAYGVVYAPALLPRARAVARGTAIGLALVGVGGALWNVGAFDRAYAGEATLPTAVAWAEEHIPSGATVLQHGPLVFLNPRSTRHTVLLLREEYANIGGRDDRRIADHRAKPLAEWLNQGVDYIVLDSRLVDRYYESTSMRLYPEMTASYRAFYDEVRSRGARVFFIEPQPWKSAGPRIELYDVRALRSR